MRTQRASIGSYIGAIVKSRSSHALSVFVCSLLAVFGIEAHAASTYYVDCSATTDGNGQSGTPWNSLLDPSAHTFVPGDALLFRRGVTCTGTLQPQGSGSSGVPITVGPYGTGTAFPVIDGAGGAYGVYLYNEQYWEISSLEITSMGASVAPRDGVRIWGANAGQTLNHIHLVGLYIHDINGGKSSSGASDQGRSGAVRLEVDDTGTPAVPTTFNDILIDQCIIKNVGRKGIISYSSYADWPSSYTDSWPTAFTDVVISRNFISAIWEDGILPQHTLSAVVENNVLRGANIIFPNSGRAAGMWAFGSNNTLFQFNESSDVATGNGDGTGYDEDYEQDHTTFQYNYSHNNSGGFMLNCPFCGTPNGSNGIVRYNISLNDGEAATVNNVSNMGGHSFYGNTVFLSGASTDSMTYLGGYDNIFYQENTPAASPQCTGPASYCSYNLLYNVASVGSDNLSAKPLFLSSGYIPTGVGNLLGYELNAGSPGIGAGTPISSPPSTDYFGNTISPTANPNIGAYDGVGGSSWNFLQNPGFETGSLGPWGGSGAVAVGTTSPHTGEYALQLGTAHGSGTYSVTGLSPNATYMFSGWEEVDSSGGAVSLSAADYDSSGSSVSQSISSTSYSPAAVMFTTGPSVTTATLTVSKSTTVGNAYGDDFVLSQGLVGNPGFESGILAPWTTSGSAVIDGTSPATGSKDLDMGSSTTVQQTIARLKPYTNYTFSGYAKVTTAGQTATLGVSNYDSIGSVTSQPVTSTAGYMYVTENFTTGPVNNSAILSVTTGAGSGGAYADSLFLNLNMIENPDFESGTPGAWKLASNAAIVQEQARTGEFALATTGSGSTGKQTICGLTPQTSYIFSAWAKLGDSSEGAHIAVQQFDSLGTVYEISVTSTSYQHYPQRFITGTTNTCVTVDLYQTSGSGSTYLDDVSLVPAPLL